MTYRFQLPHQRRSYEEAINRGASNELLLRTDLLRQPIRRFVKRIDTASLQHPSYTPQRNSANYRSAAARDVLKSSQDKSSSTVSVADDAGSLTTVDDVLPSMVALKTESPLSGQLKSESKSVSSFFASIKEKLSLTAPNVGKTNDNAVETQQEAGSSNGGIADLTAGGKIKQNRVLQSETESERSYIVDETVVEGQGREPPTVAENDVNVIQIDHFASAQTMLPSQYIESRGRDDEAVAPRAGISSEQHVATENVSSHVACNLDHASTCFEKLDHDTKSSEIVNMSDHGSTSTASNDAACSKALVETSSNVDSCATNDGVSTMYMYDGNCYV